MLRFQGIILSKIQGQAGSKVTTKDQREEPDDDGEDGRRNGINLLASYGPRNIRWQFGFSVRVSASFPRCRQGSSPTPFLNSSLLWYNPLNNNDKTSQEDEES